MSQTMWGKKGWIAQFARRAMVPAALVVASGAAHATVIDATNPQRPSARRHDPFVSMGVLGAREQPRLSLRPLTVSQDASPVAPSENSDTSRLSIIESIQPRPQAGFNPTAIDLNLLNASSQKPRRTARNQSQRVAPPAAHVSMGALSDQRPGAGSAEPPADPSSSTDPGALNDPENGGTKNYEGRRVMAADTKYFQDFEDGEQPREWELTGMSEFEDFGHFAGPFRNCAQTLYVQCEPDTPYSCEFDFLFIASQLGDPEASDVFEVTIDGQPVMTDRINGLQERNRKLNGDRPDFDDRVYRQLAVTFVPKGNGVVTIQFSCKAAGAPGGETWGLDNVHIDVAPRQTLGELGDSSGGITPGGGSLASNMYDSFGAPYDQRQSYHRGDDTIRPPGPSGPIIPPQIPVPAPGGTAVALLGSLAMLRRRR